VKPSQNRAYPFQAPPREDLSFDQISILVSTELGALQLALETIHGGYHAHPSF
jgi:hypothetical protein